MQDRIILIIRLASLKTQDWMKMEENYNNIKRTFMHALSYILSAACTKKEQNLHVLNLNSVPGLQLSLWSEDSSRCIVSGLKLKCIMDRELKLSAHSPILSFDNKQQHKLSVALLPDLRTQALLEPVIGSYFFTWGWGSVAFTGIYH